MLSNEDLFSLAVDGNEDLRPVLWERVKKFLYMQADKYYSKYTEYCTQNGVDKYDLRQQAYIAFTESFKGFDRERSSYINYLDYAFKNSLREIFKPREPMNAADSLDRPLDFEDNDNMTLGDTVPDPSALVDFETVEDTSEREDICKTVRAAIDELEGIFKKIIKYHWYDKKSLKEIGEEFGISYERVRQIEQKAFKTLRKNNGLKRLYNDLGYGSSRIYQNSVSSFKRHGQSNVESIAIARADIQIRAEQNQKNLEKYRAAYREWKASGSPGGKFIEIIEK